MRALRLLLAIAVVSGSGCVTYDRGTFSAMSTAIVPVPMTTVAENVEGMACGSLFEGPLKRAIADAVKKAPGSNALVDVTYRVEQLCMVVRATAVGIP